MRAKPEFSHETTPRSDEDNLPRMVGYGGGTTLVHGVVSGRPRGGLHGGSVAGFSGADPSEHGVGIALDGEIAERDDADQALLHDDGCTTDGPRAHQLDGAVD